MTGEELKQSLLSHAIQGKLVEQRQEEGNAENLYKEIRLEKEKLISEGKIKKSKSLPEITVEEIPFNIPSSWKWVRLKDITQTKQWKTIPKSELGNGKYPVYGANGIIGTTNRYNHSDPTLLLTCRGATCGATNISLPKSYINGNAFSFDFLSNSVNIFFLKYIFDALDLKSIGVITGTAQPQITKAKIDYVIIPLAPLEEQKRIVEKLEELAPLIDKYDQKNQELKQLNIEFSSKIINSILKYAIQGKLVEQRQDEGNAKDLYKKILLEKEKRIKNENIKKSRSIHEITEEEIPFDIPNSWTWVRFGNLTNFKIGKTPPRIENKYWMGEYPWVSIRDMVTDNYLDTTKEKVSRGALNDVFKNKIIPKGTLLMSFKLTIGKTSILKVDATHNEAIISIFPWVDSENVIRNYLFKTLPLLTSYGLSLGAIKGRTLNSNSIRNLLIPLPPLEEQKRIVEKLEELKIKINSLDEIVSSF